MFALTQTFEKPRFIILLEKLMFLFLIVFPFGAAFILIFPARISLFSSPASTIRTLVPAALVLVAIGLCIAVCRTRTWLRRTALGLWIFGGTALRIFAGFFLKTFPYSDFFLCYTYATTQSNAEQMSHVPYNAVYSIVLRRIVSLFGESPFPIIVCQAVFTALIPLLLYGICMRAFSSPALALMAAGLYALNPSMILYTCVTSPENVSPVFFTLMIFLLVETWRFRETNLKRSLLCAAGAAVSLGLTNVFKPVGSLLLIAFVATELLIYLVPLCVAWFRQPDHRKAILRAGCASIACILFCVAGQKLVFAGVTAACERELGYPISYQVDYSASSLGSVAYFGLSPVGQGYWNAETSKTIWEANAMFDDPKEANDYLMQKLIAELKEYGFPAFLNLLKGKIVSSWANEWTFGFFATRTESTGTAPSFFDTAQGAYWCSTFPTSYTTYINFGASLCFLFLLLCRRKASPFELFMTCMLGVVFCAFIILESQCRYKSTFVPLICTASAIGYANWFSLCWSAVRKKLTTGK